MRRKFVRINYGRRSNGDKNVKEKIIFCWILKKYNLKIQAEL
jgi:hypothetical protein